MTSVHLEASWCRTWTPWSPEGCPGRPSGPQQPSGRTERIALDSIETTQDRVWI